MLVPEARQRAWVYDLMPPAAYTGKWHREGMVGSLQPSLPLWGLLGCRAPVFPSMSTDPRKLSAQHGGGDQLVLLAAQQQALPYHFCPRPGAAEGLRCAGQVRLREMQGHGSPAKSISPGQLSPTENQVAGPETPGSSSLLCIGSRCRQGLLTGYLWEPPPRATRVQQGGGSALHSVPAGAAWRRC